MELKEILQEVKNQAENSNDENYSAYSTLFEEIAEMLFNQYTLKKNNIEYEFAEIEFYLRTSTLEDTCVHQYVGMDAGCFRIHYSGVDITFGSSLEKEFPKSSSKQPNKYYGGILIRGLKKDDEYIMGPLRVQLELFSGLSLDNPCLSLSLIKKEKKPKKELLWTTRQAVSGKFKDSLLCCYEKDLIIEFKESHSKYPASIRFLNPSEHLTYKP